MLLGRLTVTATDPLPAFALDHTSSAPVVVSTGPSAGEGSYGAGLVFDADPFVMTRADLGKTMKAIVRRLGDLEGLRSSAAA